MLLQRQSSIGGQKKETAIVGSFFLEHTIEESYIQEAHADYYVIDNEQNADLVPRGNWKANAVWINSSQIRILYDMQTFNEQPGVIIPPHYVGYLELDLTSYIPKFGHRVYNGFINDLGNSENRFAGRVYAEKLKNTKVWSRTKAQTILKTNAKFIIDHVTKIQFHHHNNH